MSNQPTKNNDMNDDGMLNAETQRKLPQGEILQPKLRFKGFTDPWQQRKLEELLIPAKAKNVDGKFTKNDVLSVSGEFGIVNQIALKGKSSAGESVLLYSVVNWGDAVYTKSPLKEAPYGIIKVNQGRAGIVSTLYAVYTLRQHLIVPVFLELYFDSNVRLNNYLKPLVNKGAKNDMKVKNVDVLKGHIHITPNVVEQARIAEFFRVLDDRIAAAKKKADLLKLKKRYYLQAIFGQRLRFKGFTEPWQQRKLEELCIRVGSGGTPSVQHPEYYNGKIPFLGISDLSGRTVSATQKKITQKGLDNSAAWLVPKGSITLAMYASVGKVAILGIELATSQAFFNMVIPEKTCIRDFLFSRLEKADICHEWLPLISTGTQPNLNAAKLKDWELKVPSTQERKTIGEFFHALDDLAAALARKIELLERRKTAYLQRLFV